MKLTFGNRCLALAALAAAATSALAAEPSKKSEDGAQQSESRTITVKVDPGGADKAVPNHALEVMDVETLQLVHERWKRLAGSINKSHKRPPLPEGGAVSPDAVRPWKAPAITETSLGLDNPLRIETNGIPSTAQPGSSSTVNEPSVAAVGDYVFYTANWFAAASTDGGDTWTYVNPFTGPFEEPDDVSFCCDQQAHYDPGSNSVFWLQQLIPSPESGAEGVQRVNVDQQADGSWDCFYDLTAFDAGFPGPNLADYPDLSVSANHLFVTSNVFVNRSFVGAFVARLPLSQVSACGQATVNYHTETNNGAFRTTQNAGDTMYFADHSSTASIRIWSWPDTSPSPANPVTRSTNQWFNDTRICPGPDKRDWCGAIDSRIYGAARAGDLIAFFWSAQQNPNGGFPFPYSQGIVLDTSNNLSVVDQPLIWSNDAAWVYPSLAGNSEGGFGGTVLWGGGTHYPQCSAFLADAANNMSFNPLEHTVTTQGTVGPEFNRSGDYLSTRIYSPNDKVFVGSCFAYQSISAGTSHYLFFGRDQDFATIFTDGFEFGNTASWSSTSP